MFKLIFVLGSLSNGEQYITTAQLERRIREICNTTLRKETDDADSQGIFNLLNITKDV